MQIEYIKEYSEKIIGQIETQPNIDRSGKLWAGPIVGVYHNNCNTTQEWAGKIIALGDVLSALIWKKACK